MRDGNWDPKSKFGGAAVRPGAPKRVREAANPRDKSRFAPKPKPPKPAFEDGVAILYGWHPVAAALANPARRIRKITATENGAHRLTEAGLKFTVTPEIVKPEAIDARLSPDAVHQGLLVEAYY